MPEESEAAKHADPEAFAAAVREAVVAEREAERETLLWVVFRLIIGFLLLGLGLGLVYGVGSEAWLQAHKYVAMVLYMGLIFGGFVLILLGLPAWQRWLGGEW